MDDGLGVWKQVGWQNDIRELFGMEPISPTSWPVILLTTVAVAALILIVSRSLRVLFGKVAGWLGRHLPRRLAWVLGVTGAAAAVLGAADRCPGQRVLRRGQRHVLGARRRHPADGVAAGGAGALRQPGVAGGVGHPRAGRAGSSPGWGPRAEQINTFSGGGAKEPIRAYVGLKSADTLQERADLLLAELKRTGAFDREVLVVATTTGTGFLDPRGVDPVEYVFNGDTAIAGVQYSYLPSWLSLLADKQAVRETSRVVFDTVHGYWATLPEESRPKLYLYGLSLGSYGVGSVLNSISIINEPIDGALMSGPPFVNELHKEIVANRDPGTPPWQPIYREGRTVRFTAEQPGFAKTPGPVGTDPAGLPAAQLRPGRVLLPRAGPRGRRTGSVRGSAARTSPRRWAGSRWSRCGRSPSTCPAPATSRGASATCTPTAPTWSPGSQITQPEGWTDAEDRPVGHDPRRPTRLQRRC